MSEPDLFANLPPTKSPRLLWMEKHGITVESRASSLGQVFVATAGTESAKATNSELDALAELARKLGIKLWNE